MQEKENQSTRRIGSKRRGETRKSKQKQLMHREKLADCKETEREE